eukprot:206628-Chlamydomonas_euryale.AAC.4
MSHSSQNGWLLPSVGGITQPASCASLRVTPDASRTRWNCAAKTGGEGEKGGRGRGGAGSAREGRRESGKEGGRDVGTGSTRSVCVEGRAGRREEGAEMGGRGSKEDHGPSETCPGWTASAPNCARSFSPTVHTAPHCTRHIHTRPHAHRGRDGNQHRRQRKRVADVLHGQHKHQHGGGEGSKLDEALDVEHARPAHKRVNLQSSTVVTGAHEWVASREQTRRGNKSNRRCALGKPCASQVAQDLSVPGGTGLVHPRGHPVKGIHLLAVPQGGQQGSRWGITYAASCVWQPVCASRPTP